MNTQKEVTNNELAGMIAQFGERFDNFAMITKKEFEGLQAETREGFQRVEEKMALKKEMNKRFDQVEKKIDNLEFYYDKKLSSVEDRMVTLKKVLEKDLKTKVAWT